MEFEKRKNYKLFFSLSFLVFVKFEFVVKHVNNILKQVLFCINLVSQLKLLVGRYCIGTGIETVIDTQPCKWSTKHIKAHSDMLYLNRDGWEPCFGLRLVCSTGCVCNC